MRVAGTLRREIELLLDEPIGAEFKGLPPAAGPTLRELGGQGWNVLEGDLLLPVMVLKEDALEHNLRLMARWCSERGLALAPHGKTTMAPQLFARQLEAGAWGITAATVGQVRVMRAFGVPRVLMANELVQPAGLAWLARELEADPGFDFLCLVDGTAGARRMHEALARAGAQRPVPVLVELGAPGARTGARDREAAAEVARAVSASPLLELAGVEGYEGAVAHERSPEALGRVRGHLGDLAALVAALDHEGLFAAREEIVVSAGGSAFFDEVADALGGLSASRPVRVVLRSGCYLTHDHAHYARLSPLAGSFRPALELWAEVISRPEAGLALLCFGKRDAPYDLELPVPVALRRADGGALERLEPGRLTVRDLDDQHAYVDMEGIELDVGDLVGLGISHPCTAFDKWRLLPTVDAGYGVTGAIRTFF